MSVISIKEIKLPEYSFYYPSGIYFRRDTGDFYIADMHNHCIVKWNINNKIFNVLSRNVKNGGQIGLPLAISYSRLFGIIVADARNNMVYQYDDCNNYWEPVLVNNSELILPTGVSSDKEGNIYISQVLDNAIIRLGADRKILKIISNKQHGYKDGLLQEALINRPFGIYYDSGKLYIADEQNSKVRYIELANNKIYTLKYSSKIEIRSPIAVTVSSNGNIIICEKRRMLVYSWKTKELSILIDRTIWRNLKNDFSLSTSLCYIGAVTFGIDNRVFWLDTIKNVFYEMIISI